MKIAVLLSVLFLSFLAIEMPKRLQVVGKPVAVVNGQESRRNRRKKNRR
jgi:hypothetical protein